MLRGIPYWIHGISQAKSGTPSNTPPAHPEGDMLLEQLWLEAVERRTHEKVDDVITGQHVPGMTRPAPKSGRGHWFDHR